ncbi:MAG TPA: ABC transporter transmembrane domain-containing protein, partial [bacterium]
MTWVYRILSRLTGGMLGGQDAVDTAVRLAKEIARERSTLVFAVLCMAGYSLFTAAPAWYIKDVVDTLERGDTPTLSRFAIVGVGIVVIFALRGFFFFCQNYLMGKVGEDLITRMRAELFAHLQKLSFSFFTSNPLGELVTRFTSDLINLQNALRIGITGPLRDIPLIFLLLGMLVYRSWALFLASLIIMPIALALIARFARRSKTLTVQRMTTFGEMTSLLMETINGIRVVKAFSMEKYEQQRFEAANNELHRKNMKTLRISSYSTPVLETIGAMAGGGIFMFGGFLIIRGYISTGDFASFLFLFFTLNEPIKKLNGFSLRLQEGLTAADRIFQFMDIQPEIVERPGAKHLNPIRTGLSIHVDTFYYDNNPDPVLQNIHMDVKSGQVIALVGSSGAGKTTLVNLIPRFFELKDGQILIDGQDIHEGTIASLRRQIAIVTQDIFLFNDTVAANIAYGNIECPREQIIEAAQAANAHDFISALPQGYDTVIGERGMQISGGQRQRLSIARALIKNAPILILDEATSALDSESEREVQVAIERLLQNRTTFVIAHRLSTIRKADRIYVMEAGRVGEQGRHEELLRKGGAYKRLHEMQFR